MSSEELKREIKKRRTFAIISHPDAGKTTLTEKLLLYGGAIHLAGSIKSRKTQRHAVSDWMEIEKQRGISVTSSVLQFDYAGCRINILDTPGHQDFSEDTYRTLMAVDSAVMVLDAAKGVEAQTKKLFKVCKQRHIPIFTFINKLDRYGKAPIDLMDELENVLGIRSYPMNWPVGSDGRYQGVYDRQKKQVELFSADTTHGQKARESVTLAIDDPALREALDEASVGVKAEIMMAGCFRLLMSMKWWSPSKASSLYLAREKGVSRARASRMASSSRLRPGSRGAPGRKKQPATVAGAPEFF